MPLGNEPKLYSNDTGKPRAFGAQRVEMNVNAQITHTGEPIFDYNASLATPKETPYNHDYVVENGICFEIHGISGASHCEGSFTLKIGNGAAEENFTTIQTKLTSDGNPNVDFDLFNIPKIIDGTANGTTIRLTIENVNHVDCDMYSTIMGCNK